MAAPAVAFRPRATYADLVALPDHVTGEIVAGELIVSPRPAPSHVESASAMGAIIVGPFRFGRGGPGGWWIEDQPELHLTDGDEVDVVVPDLAGWRRERMPHLPTEPYFTLPPDWVCEILSPGTAAFDRAAKMPLYQRAGVPHLWLVDPLLFTLEIYRRDEAGWRLLGTFRNDARVRAEPFQAIELELELLWGR